MKDISGGSVARQCREFNSLVTRRMYEAGMAEEKKTGLLGINKGHGMKINTISDLKALVTSLERYDDNTPLAISINGQAECFAVAPLPFLKLSGRNSLIW